ncbi:hypothetical protein OQA88_12696 [Cercophora sp. LCS_1]
MKPSLALLAALAHYAAAATDPSSPTATSETIPSATSVGIWTPLGCYAQSPLDHQITTVSGTFMSIGLCTHTCALSNFPFAGLRRGNECWCGTDLDGTLAEDQSDCNLPCPGYALDKCGGLEAMNIFQGERVGLAPSGYTGIYSVPVTTTTAAPSNGTTRTSGAGGRGSETGSVLSSTVTGGAVRNMGIFGW